MERKLRSSIPRVELGTFSYSALEKFPGNQVPTGKEVMGRMMYLTSKEVQQTINYSVDSAADQITKELQDLMIYNLNIYPLNFKNIKKKVLSDYVEFKKLSNYPRSKRSGQTYQSSCQKLVSKLETGYDIKTNDLDRQEDLAKYHGVKYGEAEIILYEDNVKVKTCLCDQNSVTKCQECPRQVFAEQSIDKDWLESEKEKREEIAKELKAKEKSDQEIAELFKKVDSSTIPLAAEPDMPEAPSSDDVFISPIPLSTFDSPASVSTRLRSSSPSSISSCSSPSNSTSFPKIPVRFGRKTMNPKVMIAAVHVSSKYDISLSTTVKIFADIMNMVVGQEWTIGSETEDENAELSENDIVDVENPAKKPRKIEEDLTYRFPSRQTLAAWLKDAAILNLKFMGDVISNKEEGTVVTWGTDDTVKKAGHKVFDSKSNHITVKGSNNEKQTFTTGFDPNLSHTGQDSAFSINTKLKMLAVLCSSTVEEMKGHVNFWMGDRADDFTKAFELLGIQSGRVLRCSAHITIGADAAVNKVFKLFENTVGIQNLITLNAGQAAFINNNSVFTMAIHALSKLLSYSHATLPYSLCVMYKKWRKSECKDNLDFEDFSSNRFGRTATLAKRFLQHRDDLIQFFDQCVDEHANKLGESYHECSYRI